MSGVRVQGDGSTNVNGITVNTPYDDPNKQVSIEDFLQLMIAQMKNQDILGSGGGGSSDNGSNYVTQMAQISTMQQMQELAYYSKTNYAMSLVGKEVTVATLGLGGKVNRDTGLVEKVTLDNNEYLVYVNGKGYKLSEIMNVGVPGAEDSTELDKLKDSQIRLTHVNETSVGISWNQPKIDEDEEDDIVYKVYISKESNFQTAEEIKKGDLVDTKNPDDEDRYTAIIEDLEPGETYFINVLAVTPSGREYPYKQLTVNMKD